MSREPELTVLTIGHSTRTLEEFTEILKTYAVTLVVDVRRAPQSRHNPQFNKESLPDHLKPLSIKYIHLPEIGGLRHATRNSINLALENASFRGYADYMQTKDFTEALLKVVALARENRLVLMCAEALPWKCHRILISDTLVARHVKVRHIISKTDAINHQLNELAQVNCFKLSYPLYAKNSPQRALGDFGIV